MYIINLFTYLLKILFYNYPNKQRSIISHISQKSDFQTSELLPIRHGEKRHT